MTGKLKLPTRKFKPSKLGQALGEELGLTRRGVREFDVVQVGPDDWSAACKSRDGKTTFVGRGRTAREATERLLDGRF